MTQQERLSRECVQLFVRGLDPHQIANALNVTETTVYRIFQTPGFRAELETLGYELNDSKMEKTSKHTPMPKFFYTAFSFKGRINRRTYWLTGLTNLSFLIIFFGLVYLVASPALVLFYLIWGFISSWSGLAVSTKRLHDCNMSGWWQLFSLIPLLGWIWAVITFGFLKGTDGPNRFGPKP